MPAGARWPAGARLPAGLFKKYLKIFSKVNGGSAKEKTGLRRFIIRPIFKRVSWCTVMVFHSILMIMNCTAINTNGGSKTGIDLFF